MSFLNNYITSRRGQRSGFEEDGVGALSLVSRAYHSLPLLAFSTNTSGTCHGCLCALGGGGRRRVKKMEEIERRRGEEMEMEMEMDEDENETGWSVVR